MQLFQIIRESAVSLQKSYIYDSRVSGPGGRKPRREKPMRGWTYMVSTWRGVGVGGKAKLICYWTWGVGESAGKRVGVSECSERRNLFLIKENWICVMARHLSQTFTGKPPFDPDVRPWSHPLIMSLHFLCAELKNRMRGQFECDMTWFCSCFDFVCLRFQVVQIKQVDCKISTKNVNNCK